MKTIVFFLEEPSAKEMLSGLLPRLLSADIQPRYIVFRGKQDLEKNLTRKLRGWRLPDSAFVVIRDQDSGDCHEVKSTLADLCYKAGRDNVLIRIACRELESFYLGDLAAVEKGLGLSSLSAKQNSRKFRSPDNLGNPSQELLKLTKNVYQKVAGSRSISPYLNLDNNSSHSFNVLISGIRQLAKG
ncbi:conserved hypothetical protein [uncultured Desulfobacterium sp.]|uniref:DUF4276 family protein n=1 Tax=uncultured Desulfobacterium sp. TaxID=201089 RepID=A0A445MV21_9BACT|nr:conserved hypothetical protein [uncultured Desulfobacterium sp.]